MLSQPNYSRLGYPKWTLPAIVASTAWSQSFGPPTTFPAGGNAPNATLLVDVSNDGKADLITANVTSDNVSVLLGTGAGSFGTSTTFSTGFSTGYGQVAVAVGDLNKDGNPDIVAVNEYSPIVSVLLGDGGGNFGPVTPFDIGLRSISVKLADVKGNVRILNGIIDMGAYELAPDLTPLLYARPTLLYGTAPFSVVVDVIETNGVSPSGLITLKITKEAKATLLFDNSQISVGGRSVNNGSWSMTTDATHYILTSSEPIVGGGKLSVGLGGQFTAGSTTGMLTCSATVLYDSEGNVGNNTDADKIEYFQQ